MASISCTMTNILSDLVCAVNLETSRQFVASFLHNTFGKNTWCESNTQDKNLTLLMLYFILFFKHPGYPRHQGSVCNNKRLLIYGCTTAVTLKHYLSHPTADQHGCGLVALAALEAVV